MTGALLMGTTLPTVIGMGVVAETTRVMFDKHGRKITKTVRKRTTKNFKVHQGPRGGKYVLRKGRKIYI